MCEFLAVCSDQPVCVDFSLQSIAAHGGNTGPHRDGWGIACYEGLDVLLFKEAEAAANSQWVRFLDSHPLTSQTTIAHIRRATLGVRNYANTQPFVRELGGQAHVFARNGHLPGLSQSPAFSLKRFHPVEDIDSEWVFCALLNRIADDWLERPGTVPSLESRFAAVSAFAAAIRPFGPANFLYADGDAVFAHGHKRRSQSTGEVEVPGLVSLSRWCRGSERGIVTKGLTVSGAGQVVTLIASVPLTGEPWTPFAEGEVRVVRHGRGQDLDWGTGTRVIVRSEFPLILRGPEGG